MLNLYDQSQFLKGGRTQEIIWIEELGELQHEITKSLRGMLNKEHLIEELADVLICLEQLKLKYNISDEQIQSWIDFKYERNRKRQEQKVSKLEYDIMRAAIDYSCEEEAFKDVDILYELLINGYFKGAKSSDKVIDFFKNCEVSDDV